MLENIKLDIIYYNTQKDFEMEFNLCGCCRMRLLTAAAEDLKGFVNCIKVAVARSRVVLLCGELYGDAGLFNIISRAVGRDFEEIENPLYGIAGEGKTRLLKQSIPLVTSNGTLLGCVIEQGPQAIIMISEDKNGRKEIMQNLVHPYIKELSKSETGVAENLTVDVEKTENEVSATPEIEETNEPLTDSPITENVVCEIETESETETENEADELEISAESDNDDDSELETVSLEDFCDSTDNETNETVEPEIEKSPEIEPENEETEEENEEDIEIPQDDETETDIPVNDSGLVFGHKEFDDEDESDSTVFSSDVFKQYNENFSLITPINEKNKRYKHGRNRGNSPIILILLCLVLCLLGIIIYFLFIKPTQAGITIGENFNNLFSFALKGVHRPW